MPQAEGKTTIQPFFHIVNPIIPAGPARYSKVTPIRHRVLARYPQILHKAFAKYPDQIIKTYLKAIRFAGEIDQHGFKCSGSYDPFRRIVLLINPGNQTKEDAVSTFHHEFSLLLFALLKENLFLAAAACGAVVPGAGVLFFDLTLIQNLSLAAVGFYAGLLLTLAAGFSSPRTVTVPTVYFGTTAIGAAVHLLAAAPEEAAAVHPAGEPRAAAAAAGAERLVGGDCRGLIARDSWHLKKSIISPVIKADEKVKYQNPNTK